LAVVEVTLGSGHPAPGEDAGLVAGLDVAGLGSGGAAAGGSVPGDPAGVVDHGGPPLSVLLVGSDLSGNIGNHWSPTGDLTGAVGKTDQGFEIHMDIHRPTPTTPARSRNVSVHASTAGLPTAAHTMGAGEQVEVHVGTQLIHGPTLMWSPEGLGNPVDALHRRAHPIRSEL
jgi:hypothetical protein